MPGPEDLIPQSEKRRVLEDERRMRERGSTFLEHTHEETELGRYGGRQRAVEEGIAKTAKDEPRER